MERGEILVAEGERSTLLLINQTLRREGFYVIEATGGKSALETFRVNSDKIRMIIADAELDEKSGWTLCAEIRKSSDVPVFMLISKLEDSEEAYGFDMGVDRFVRKPVNPVVLSAGINSFFRRIEGSGNRPEDKHYAFNGIVIDDNSHMVKVDDADISLTPKEYALLLILAKNRGRLVSREQLLHHAWGYEYFGGLRTVDTHINRLREKLSVKGNCISTIRGFGYKFDVTRS